MISALLHAHSTYSDGEFTLTELRHVCERSGRQVLMLADHAEYFDAARVAQYVEECRALSDDTVQLVPGLEFGCDAGMHIVGYGVTALTQQRDPESVIAHIQAHAGVSVIAHPKDDHFARIEALTTVPLGVEAWNTKYDGRYAPRAQTFALIARMRARHPALLAFYGLDLHWRKQFRGLELWLDAASNRAPDVLAALKRGAFRARHGRLELDSRTTPPDFTLRRFRAVNWASRAMWRSLKALKRASGGLGDRVPAPIKAQLRRIF
jgi:hypothetical protein